MHLAVLLGLYCGVVCTTVDTGDAVHTPHVWVEVWCSDLYANPMNRLLEPTSNLNALSQPAK